LITSPSSFSLWSNSPQTHTHTHTHLIGLLWPSDQLVAEATTHTTRKKHKTQETNIMPSSGFQLTILGIKGLHTYSLDRMATGIYCPPLRPNFLTLTLTLPNHTLSDVVSSLSSFVSRSFISSRFSLCVTGPSCLPVCTISTSIYCMTASRTIICYNIRGYGVLFVFFSPYLFIYIYIYIYIYICICCSATVLFSDSLFFP